MAHTTAVEMQQRELSVEVSPVYEYLCDHKLSITTVHLALLCRMTDIPAQNGTLFSSQNLRGRSRVFSMRVQVMSLPAPLPEFVGLKPVPLAP